MHVRIATFGGWQSLGLLSPGHSMLHCPEGLARQALFSVPCLSPFGEREGNEGDIRNDGCRFVALCMLLKPLYFKSHKILYLLFIIFSFLLQR